ncbi:Hemolysin transporter protein shlB precursor [Chromobacterium violaceum]|uniref:Hemolysin transporter protein shlB n=1 Tax=Chromobacterium violaceum TaxID=536 RepID=A0A447TBL5_CHRVL|nr:Hemolysin transporter protein shlB precursor [Chromobacterium violaceum]
MAGLLPVGPGRSLPPLAEHDGADARRLLQDSDRRFDNLIQQQRMRQLKSEGSNLEAERAPQMEEGSCLPVSGLKLAGIRLLSREEVTALGRRAEPAWTSRSSTASAGR